MKIFWIQFTATTTAEILDDLPSILVQAKSTTIFTPNPEILLKQNQESEFRNILKQADYLVPDGIWLYIAAQLLEYDSKIMRVVLLPYFFFNLFFRRTMLYGKYWERICGSDLTRLLLDYAVKNNVGITILDPFFPKDLPKVASQKNFKKNLSEQFPGLNFDFFIYNPEHKSNIISQIRKSDSQILFSTLWMKVQEQSILEIMSQCWNIKLWLWVGSSFDYFIGFQKRAPKLWSLLWLEWLYRLATSPNKTRQFSKVWNAICVFLWKVINN